MRSSPPESLARRPEKADRLLERTDNQTTLLRENFGDPAFGTCRETFDGGFHYRVWRQNGTEANSGAWFLAASEEYNLTLQHDIVPNGCVRPASV